MQVIASEQIELLVARYEELKAQAGKLFDEQDQIEKQLVEALRGEPGAKFVLKDGRVARAKNNFTDPATGEARNKAFRPACVKFWEAVIERKR